jgi:Tol biopolymer transport system component
MYRMKKAILLCIWCSVVITGYTQTVLETNPTNIKWQQVRTENFRVLFPKGFDLQAQRVANTLEHIRSPEARTLGKEPRRISVVLQNQTTVSNGFVSMLPRRSEFSTMPPQDYNFIGTNDWLDLLASHEYRHIVQYQHANRGFNRLIYFLFGSTSFAGMSQAAAPQWFWEGDAVATETAFTPSGRGRIPNFGLLMRTNLLEGRVFNYHKQYLRSYKHNIPDHYVLGYYMVAHLRQKTNDPDIWEKITARSWSVPFIPFAFSNAIHRETGMYVTDLYRDMAKHMASEWQARVDRLTLTQFSAVPTPRRGGTYTDFLYPQPVERGVVVMKKGLSNIEQFVLLKSNGDAERVFVPGYINDTGMLSASQSRIAWTEFGYDPRWLVRNYSQIKVYDMATGKKWRVGPRRSRLSGAALSPDGRQIVTVSSDHQYLHAIKILDVSTGNVVNTFDNPGNPLLAMPRWSSEGDRITVLKTSREGKTISIIDVATGNARDVLAVTSENVGSPALHGKYLLFNSPITGIDNIFAVNLESNERFQVTSSKYGAYNPAFSPDGKRIFYNEQTRDGLDVVSIAFDPASWMKSGADAAGTDDALSQSLTQQEGQPDLFENIPQRAYPATKYHKVSGIINPYNWGAYVNNDLTQVNLGITSRDLLSTTAITVGYAYDINEGTSLWHGGVSYQGLYPIIDAEVQYGNRENIERGFGNEVKFTWDELILEGGVRLPFVLTNSKYSRRVILGNAIGLTQVSSFRNQITRQDTLIYDGHQRANIISDTLFFIYPDQLSDGNLVYNRAVLSFVNLLKRSPRDFLSRWGQTLDVEFYNTPFQTDFVGQLFAVRSTFYFPGLFRHHYLYARAGFQNSPQDPDPTRYAFRNRIVKPRGQTFPRDETFVSLSGNYAFPIWYPDVALGPVLNIQRIKANVFFDYGKGQGRQFYYNSESGQIYYLNTDETYQSAGIETTFDFNFMRFLPKFELGFRSTYVFENTFNSGGMVFEFIIGNIGF